MCCLLPCMPFLRRLIGLEEERNAFIFNLVLAEIVRWLAIALPIFLSVWRYAELQYGVGCYPEFISGWDPARQYWMTVTLILVTCTLFVYIPTKVLYIYHVPNCRKRYGWRPSILVYMFMCAAPCIIIIVIAIKRKPIGSFEMCEYPVAGHLLDQYTALVLQIVVLGLTLTEWMAKFREEVFSYDLIVAMSHDFFFAYDVIAFIMMSAKNREVFETYWFYVTFGLAFFAMFKYLPSKPCGVVAGGGGGGEQSEEEQLGVQRGRLVCVLAQLIFNDLPFAIVRMVTIHQYGLLARVSDLYHPTKNVALIIFGLTQLYVIYVNYYMRKRCKDPKFCEGRRPRYDTAKGMSPGGVKASPAGILGRHDVKHPLQGDPDTEQPDSTKNGSVDKDTGTVVKDTQPQRQTPPPLSHVLLDRQPQKPTFPFVKQEEKFTKGYYDADPEASNGSKLPQGNKMPQSTYGSFSRADQP